MSAENENIHLTPEAVAKLCLDKYRDLPKTGKPDGTQWTVLAGIVLYNALQNRSQVVSLGLGTKCIGGSKMCRNGLIVNDSHAEVLTRRGFMRYLYEQIRKTNKSEKESTSIIAWDAEKQVYKIKSQYSFHFYSSQSPCGDACIVDETVEAANVTPAKRRKLSSQRNEGNVGTVLTSNIVYTGGKLLDDVSNGDRMAQTLGALRIKPGKGDRTLSMSCSDKMSKWCFLGVQGALMYKLLEKPIYFASMNFSHGSNLDALQRALYNRWKSNGANFKYDVFKQHKSQVRICDESLSFECAQRENCNQPCPNGLVFCNVSDGFKACEIIVNGKRQGCTKKALATAEAAVKISKYKLLQDFIAILGENNDLQHKCNLMDSDLTTLRYCDAKNLAKSYQTAWAILKTKHFGLWTQKPTVLLEFSLSTVNSYPIKNL